MKELIESVSNYIIKEYNLYLLNGSSKLNVRSPSLHKLYSSHMSVLKMIDSPDYIRFNSTHIYLQGTLYELEELTPDIEFNLRLVLNELSFQKYCIAISVISKVQIMVGCYISTDVLKLFRPFTEKWK